MEICSKKKGDKNTTGRVRETERQRGETKRREEKVRGTAQESFSHEVTQHKIQTTKIKEKKQQPNNTPITTHSKKDPRVPSSFIASLWRTEKKTTTTATTQVLRKGRHHHDIWPRDCDMHKLYTGHPQRSIESQLLAGRMDGMTGRGLLIETEEERELEHGLHRERGGGGGGTQTGGGRRSSAKEEGFF